MELRAARWSAAVLLAALTPAGVAEAQTFRFTKGPYLQALGASSVVVQWEGSSAVGGRVELTGPDETTREVTTEEPSAFHAVTVDGLKAATTYRYRIKAGDATSSEGKFTTAPEDARPFTFLLYGDNRTDHEAHAAVVSAMHTVPSDFLIHTGDMVVDGDRSSDWERFFQVESLLLRDRCTFACVGNHEMSGGNAVNFLRYFQTSRDAQGRRTLFFSQRWSNARFFFLNAFSPWAAGAERAWLDQELARSSEEPGLEHRFVVMHHGPGSSGPHGPNRDLMTSGVLDVMRKHRVTLVMAGHDHTYERGDASGLRYIVSGGGGAPLYKPRKQFDLATRVIEQVHHFVEVRVDGTSVSTIARRVDKSVLERCEIRPEGWACQGLTEVKHAPPGTTSSSGKRACDCSVPGPPEASPWAPLALLALAPLLRRSARSR